MSLMGHTRSFGDVRLNVRFARKFRTRLGDSWARRYRVGTEGFPSTVVAVTPNFALLEMSHRSPRWRERAALLALLGRVSWLSVPPRSVMNARRLMCGWVRRETGGR
jgi:hypothetical protein